MYETDVLSMSDYIKPFIENPFHKEHIINHVKYSEVVDSESPDNPRPICELSATAWNGSVTIGSVRTREDMRRKGLATYALHLVQDYYTRNKDIKEKKLMAGGVPYLYASKHRVDDNLQYKSRFEHYTGAFGELLSRVKSKVLSRDAKDAYLKFLKSNHFDIQESEYHNPFRKMRRRDILDDAIINEDTARNHIQIFDGIIEFDPSEFTNENVK